VEVALRPRRPRDKALGIKNRPFLKDAPSTSARVVKVLDICSGSGCISILLHSLLREEINIKTTGWDISKKAVQLSNVNRIALLPEDANINFVTRDIFTELPAEEPCQYDIVISNPPYISTPSFDRQLSGRWKETLPTARSVRNWEPKEALVPPMQLNNFFPEDVFYRRILELNRDKFKSRILVLEVGDFRQAKRVAHLAHDVMGEGHWIEFWCDNIEGPSKWWRIHLPKQYSRGPGTTTRKITSLGSGSPRAVVIYKDWPRGRPCGEIRPNADRIGCDAKA
jgi:methylase of polypeptide subunit release factors